MKKFVLSVAQDFWKKVIEMRYFIQWMTVMAILIWLAYWLYDATCR